MCPSESRHVRARRTTRRLPSTACSLFSVSWSKVCLNQAACCCEIVTKESFSGRLPDELGVGALAQGVLAVHRDRAARSAVVRLSVNTAVGVVSTSELAIEVAEDRNTG